MFVEKNRAIVTKNLSIGICTSNTDELYEYNILNDKKDIIYIRMQNKKHEEKNNGDAVEMLRDIAPYQSRNGSYLLLLVVSIDDRFNILYSNSGTNKILLISQKKDIELYIKSKESICAEDSSGKKHVQVCYPTSKNDIDEIIKKIHNLRKKLEKN